MQFTDPKAQGYTTVEASNGATLEAKWEFKRNIRPWSRSLYIGVVKDFLAPGDTITIRFGDRRHGSPGIRVQTYCESEFEFRVFADPIATYDYVALPESPKICHRAGARACIGAPCCRRWCAPASRSGCRSRPTTNGAIPPTSSIARCGSRPIGRSRACRRRLRFAPGAFAADGRRACGCSGPATARSACSTTAGQELCRANPLRVVPKDAPLVHFWGDTHGQSNETLGTNTAREYFEFGRDKAFLDVMGHQGNDFQITGAFWRELNALTREFDSAGPLRVHPGLRVVGQHRGGRRPQRALPARGRDHPPLLARPDRRCGRHRRRERRTPTRRTSCSRSSKGKDCVVVAHVGGRYADIKYAHDPMETAVEVHSAWGTFEWILRDAFEKNYRVGIVANSDGHKGRPGACYPGASFFGSYGGLTCFLAERLDRDAIFEAMRRRRHYATTGNRAFLSVTAELASEAEVFLRDPAAGPHTLGAYAPAVDGRHRPRRRRRGRSRHRGGGLGADRASRHLRRARARSRPCAPMRPSDLGARVRLVYEGAEYRGRARTTTWDGSLTVEGTRILRTAVINNWNLDRGIQRQDATSLAFKAVTTGNYGAIDLWLEHATGKLAFKTAPVSGEAAIAELGVEPRVFAAGGLERAVKLQRLPEVMTEPRMALRRRIKLRPTGDTRLYVRVQQEDGHRMWSSPIYLFR